MLFKSHSNGNIKKERARERVQCQRPMPRLIAKAAKVNETFKQQIILVDI